MNQALLKLVVEATSFKPLAGRIRAIWAVVKEFAPYAAIELVLPGGTVLAILYWLFRRRRVGSGSAVQPGSIPRLIKRIATSEHLASVGEWPLPGGFRPVGAFMMGHHPSACSAAAFQPTIVQGPFRVVSSTHRAVPGVRLSTRRAPLTDTRPAVAQPETRCAQ